MTRILVAGVGNILRRDDGFGPVVVSRLGPLPEGVDVVETGIGGLVIVDAVDQGADPGTVFVIEPEIGEPEHVPDIHLANPQRVLSMAKGLGILPARVVIIGCQPAEVDELGIGLSPVVERAVEVAAQRIRETVDAWL